MSEVIIPNFGEILEAYLTGVPPEALPYFLSQLERTAAARYRGWAEDVPDHAEGILACAGREDEIADKVEALFPPSDEHRSAVGEVVPAAKDAYYNVFAGYTSVEQMTIQANAERQGAGAWQALKEIHPEMATQLDELSDTEVKSAEYLESLTEQLS